MGGGGSGLQCEQRGVVNVISLLGGRPRNGIISGRGIQCGGGFLHFCE